MFTWNYEVTKSSKKEVLTSEMTDIEVKGWAENKIDFLQMHSS